MSQNTTLVVDPGVTSVVDRLLKLAANRGVSLDVVDGRLKLTGKPEAIGAIKPQLTAHKTAIVEAIELRRKPTHSTSNPVVTVGGSGGNGEGRRLAALLDIADAIQRDRGAGLTAAQIDAVWWLGELADAKPGAVDDAGHLVDADDVAWPIRRAIDTLAAGPPPNQSNDSAAANVWLDRVERFQAAWESASWLTATPEWIAANLVATWPTFEETTQPHWQRDEGVTG